MKSLLEVNDLKVHFPITKGIFSRTAGYVYAVDGVSFELGAGETLGIVGESGCGKTTTGLAILRLIEPTDGQVIFQGIDIARNTKQERLLRRTQLRLDTGIGKPGYRTHLAEPGEKPVYRIHCPGTRQQHGRGHH